jgi:hypothetical protein
VVLTAVFAGMQSGAVRSEKQIPEVVMRVHPSQGPEIFQGSWLSRHAAGRHLRRVICGAILGFASVLPGCGYGGEDLVLVSVTPAAATAPSGSTVQFTATGNFLPKDCAYDSSSCYITTRVLNDTIWSTSDTGNISIDVKGLATCISSTNSPATITAASHENRRISGVALLTCT